MVFSATTTDWYEWMENYEKEFGNRVKNAIDGDTTMQTAYAPDTFLMLNDGTDRYDIGNANDRVFILVHSVTTSEHVPVGAQREKVELEATVTVFVRSARGVSSNVELATYGDGTAATPGLLEVVGDIRTLFMNNMLVEGGARYISEIMVGPTTSDDLTGIDLDDEVQAASVQLRATKALTYGS